MRTAPSLVSALMLINLSAVAGPAGAQEKPGVDSRRIEAQNRAVERQREEDRRREAARYARAQEALRVQADTGACLASHRQRGTCLLTAADFNRFAGTVEPEGDVSGARIREVRRAMLKELLRADFLSDRLAEAGLADKVAETGMAEEKRVWQEAAKDVGRQRLRDLYARYREFFAAREERTYDIVASTDSALADSLYRLASRAPRADSSARPVRVPLPWARVSDSSLPPTLAAAGLKLRKWRCSPLLHWKAGWAFLRPAEVNRIPAVSFEDALPSLVGLAGYVPPDSTQAGAAALAYFRGHPREFALPDTLMVEARLDPGSAADSGALRPAAPLRLSAADLPADAAFWLRTRDSLRAGAVLGPRRMGLGWWSLRVLDARPGRGMRSFAQVRDSLAALFLSGRAQAFMAERSESLHRKRRDRGMRIFEEMLDQGNPPTPEEIARALAADSSGMALPPSMTAEEQREVRERLAAMHVRDRKRDDAFSAWLDRSVILSGI